MTYYVFVFNGLDVMITGPFPNEEAAMAAELRISLSSTQVAMGTEHFKFLPEFVQWQNWPIRFPEFTFP